MVSVCTFVYQTLDNMDGKQARRTGTSSPLGLLMDHGVRCRANSSEVFRISVFKHLIYWVFQRLKKESSPSSQEALCTASG